MECTTWHLTHLSSAPPSCSHRHIHTLPGVWGFGSFQPEPVKQTKAFIHRGDWNRLPKPCCLFLSLSDLCLFFLFLSSHKHASLSAGLNSFQLLLFLSYKSSCYSVHAAAQSHLYYLYWSCCFVQRRAGDTAAHLSLLVAARKSKYEGERRPGSPSSCCL